MPSETMNAISTDLKSDDYVESILTRATKQRDELIAEVPALQKIQDKFDTSLENIDQLEDRLLILAAASRYMTNKR